MAWSYKLIVSFLVATNLISASGLAATEAKYNPTYWVWRVDSNEAIVRAKELGFGGVGVMAAEHDGKKQHEYPSKSKTMTYYFPSPTLADKSWANFGGDYLTPLVKAAHENDLKIFANFESINPHRWPAAKKYYNPKLLKGLIRDLHDCGFDRVFEEVFGMWSDWSVAIAKKANESGIEYQSGGPSSTISGVVSWQNQTRMTYPQVFKYHNPISMYYYRFLRDVETQPAFLAQNSDLAYGFAKNEGKKTALIYPLSFNWGVEPEYWPTVSRACCLIAGLRFRVDDIMLIGAGFYHQDYNDLDIKFDVPKTKAWVNSYVEKQENRRLLNIVVHLTSEKRDNNSWNWVVLSTDAIAGGAFNAGYNIICSSEILPDADAYYIYTTGDGLDLTDTMTKVFETDKPVFLQCGDKIPSDANNLTKNWKFVLEKCGVDVNCNFSYGKMPLTGIYNNTGFNYTGFNLQTGKEVQKGTIIPKEAVKGEIYARSKGTPLIIGQNNKFLIPANCISWQVNYPISHLLAGCGIKPFSNVWGIAGKNVTALLAITDTLLEIDIPELEKGSEIKITQWDKYHSKKSTDTTTYTPPYKRYLSQYDLITIEQTPSKTPDYYLVTFDFSG